MSKFYVNRTTSTNLGSRTLYVEKIRSTLESRLSQPGHVVLTRLGGSGKTQLALKFALIYSTKYTAVLFADAHSTKSIEASFREIADVLGFENPAEDILCLRPLVSSSRDVNIQSSEYVHSWMAKQSAPWLLILDGLDEPSSVSPLKYLPQRGNGHILTTSRVAEMSEISYQIEIDSLLEIEAIEILLLRLRPNLEDDLENKGVSDAEHVEAFFRCQALNLDTWLAGTGC
jgi:hypothetical protein